jgi:hypothetical protein
MFYEFLCFCFEHVLQPQHVYESFSFVLEVWALDMFINETSTNVFKIFKHFDKHKFVDFEWFWPSLTNETAVDKVAALGPS